MSTVAPQPDAARHERDHGRIRHPLDRLRKYINTYVVVEAVGLIALVFTLAFWVGFWLDFGAFKAITFDWVQVPGSQIMRGIVLFLFIALMIALVAFVVMTRFFKEFRDRALALVLERRFPAVLGDRLITAVELHDPRSAAKYGYSPALVEQTIHEAADRVEQVPVAEVFAWKRLYTYGMVLLYLTIGLYMLTGIGFCAHRAALNRVEDEVKQPIYTGFGDFHDVALTWAERNILLRNVIWPRSAHLELLPLDPTKDKNYEPRIARDQTPPTLRVRAWRYVIADSKTDEGWRLLTWDEVNKRLSVKTEAPKGDGWTPRDGNSLTVDEVELKLDAFPVRKGKLANGEALPATYCTLEADGKTWRALTWSDLSQERLGGLPVPPLPAGWEPNANAVGMIGMGGVGGFDALPAALHALAKSQPKAQLSSLSIDDVLTMVGQTQEKINEQPKREALEAQLTEIRRAIDYLDHLAGLRESLDGVEAKATDRDMRRTVRRLRVPNTAKLYFFGKKTSTEVDMTRVPNNEFTGEFRNLKETVSYFVVGRDYVTPLRRLIVVEKPRLEKLESEEERPAYLYYRPTDPWKPSEMRGRRQKFAPIPVSLSGQATTIEVPVNTTLTLTGTSSKPLKRISIVEQERLRQLLAQVRPHLVATMAWVEAKQADLKQQPLFAALDHLLGVIGKADDTHAMPVIVKAFSNPDTVNHLDYATPQLLLVADRLPAAGELTATFDKARNDDRNAAKILEDVKLLKDVRDLLKGRVLDRLGEPKLVGSGETKTFQLAVEIMGRDVQKFTFDFEDTDGVRDERAVVIQPREDAAPTIREFNPDDVIRRGKEGFLVSSNARIPFKGRVRDDQGLSQVRYGCKVTPADFLSEQQYLRFNGIGAVLPLGRPETRLLGMMYLALANRLIANSANEEGSDEQLIEIPAFEVLMKANQQRDGRSEVLDAKTVMGLLETPQKDNFFRRLMQDFSLMPDRWQELAKDKDALDPTKKWYSAEDVEVSPYFDLPLWKLKHRGEPLKERDLAKPQKRYQVEIRLLAEDTYAEGTEMMPAILYDGRREEERTKLRDRVDQLRPIIAVAVANLPPEKRGKQTPHPLEAALQLIGFSSSALDLMTIGRNLTTPEGEKLLEQLATILGANEKVPALTKEITALLKEREPVPHQRPSSETFTFVVVPDGELIGKIGEEEEAKQRELLKQMKPLKDASIRMSDAQNELAQGANELVLTGTVARCDTVDDALRSALGDVIAVRNAYDRIVREYRLNQLDAILTKKVYLEVALPLGQIVDKQFDVTIGAVRALRRTVDNKDMSVADRAREAKPKAQEAAVQINELLKQLTDVIDKMKGITEINELIKLLQEIEDEESKLEKTILRVRKELIDRLLKGATNP